MHIGTAVLDKQAPHQRDLKAKPRSLLLGVRGDLVGRGEASRRGGESPAGNSA